MQHCALFVLDLIAHRCAGANEFTPFNRREAATLIGAAIGISTSSVRTYVQQPRLAFMTPGQGSAFLPYGQAIAKVLPVAGLDQIDVVESKGSNENLSSTDASPTVIGMAFLGSAVDALNGTGSAAGNRHENVRALYFQCMKQPLSPPLWHRRASHR